MKYKFTEILIKYLQWNAKPTYLCIVKLIKQHRVNDVAFDNEFF